MKAIEFFQDERGALSSTRLVGISSGLALFIITCAQAFSSYEITISDSLADALATTCVGCLVGAQLGKFAKASTPPESE